MNTIVKQYHWKGWAAVTIGSDLKHLEELYNEGENLFRRKINDFELEFDQKTKNFTEEEKAEYGDYVSDEFWKLSEVFPQIFRSSFLSTCFSRLEHELKDICDSIYQYKNSYKQPNLNTILTCKTYLINNVGIDKKLFNKFWDNILVYRLIRNCFTHSDGYVQEKGKEQIKVFFTKNPALGELKDFKIILQSNFCHIVIDDINMQLISIYDYMRMHKINTHILSIFGNG